jgi:predicted ATPase
MITVVAGPCGAGKTTWILQELAQASAPAIYVTPGVGTVPIDATRVAARFPQVDIFIANPRLSCGSAWRQESLPILNWAFI